MLWDAHWDSDKDIAMSSVLGSVADTSLLSESELEPGTTRSCNAHLADSDWRGGSGPIACVFVSTSRSVSLPPVVVCCTCFSSLPRGRCANCVVSPDMALLRGRERLRW